MSADLIDAEVNHIYSFYNPEGRSLEDIRKEFWTKNHVGETILVRLKMRTPHPAHFLSLKNWVIYLEDDLGTGYEPIEIQEMGVVRPADPVELEYTGETIWSKGRMFPPNPNPGEKRPRLTYNPSEARVKLFFPARNFLGAEITTRFLKLSIRSSEDSRPYYDLSGEFHKAQWDVYGTTPPSAPVPIELQVTWWFGRPNALR